MVPFARRLLILGPLTITVASCSSSTSPTGGSLTVTVSAPSGVTPAITITGPNGYHTSTASTVRLTALAPGSYAITAANVSSSSPIVATPYVATVTGTPATVSAGGSAAATVSYTARAGSGGLWVVGGTTVSANIANAATEYTAAQLGSSGVTSPATTLQFPTTNGGNINANGLAFDAKGNLWVVNDNTNTVVEYPAATLGSSGTPTPAMTLQLPPSSYAQAIAFDASGDLWVATFDSATIVEFTSQQLQAGGSPAGAVTLSTLRLNQPGVSGGPQGLVFDGHGNLWVSVLGSSSGLIQYTPSQLASSGAPVPAIQITSTVDNPYYLVFDQDGNLWCANQPYSSNNVDYPGTITELTAASLTTSGSPAPAVTLTLPISVNSFATSLAFDNSGNLWYLDFTHAVIGEFTSAQLGASGAPTPAFTITTKPFYGVALAFNP